MVTQGFQSGYILASDSWPHTPASDRTLKSLSGSHQQREAANPAASVSVSASAPLYWPVRSFMAAMMGISALRSHHPLPLSTARPATALPRATSPTSHQPRSLTHLRCRCRRSLPHSSCSSSPRASLSSGAPDSAAFMALAPNNAALRHRLIAPNSTAGSGDAAATGGLPSVSARSVDRESNRPRHKHILILCTLYVCMYV
jgi:hypothetical protein